MPNKNFNMTSEFQSIKEKEKIVLEKLKEWGILDQIAYLTYPEFWNGDADLIDYQRNFCQTLKSPNSTSYAYLSMSSCSCNMGDIDGVPPGGILLAMRIVNSENEVNKSNLLYLLPRKAGGIRFYVIKKLKEGLELSNLTGLFDKYLEMFQQDGIVMIKNIDEILSLQLTDINVFKTYMQGMQGVQSMD